MYTVLVLVGMVVPSDGWVVLLGMVVHSDGWVVLLGMIVHSISVGRYGCSQ